MWFWRFVEPRRVQKYGDCWHTHHPISRERDTSQYKWPFIPRITKDPSFIATFWQHSALTSSYIQVAATESITCVRLLLMNFIYPFSINLPLFSTLVPSNICTFLSCRPFVLNTTLSTGLVGVEVTSVTERPTGQKHKYNSWDDGGK